MRTIIWFFVFLLVVAHQDFWNWESTESFLGLPITLSYHMCLSVAASVVWALACFLIFPRELEDSSTANSSEKGDQ